MLFPHCKDSGGPKLRFWSSEAWLSSCFDALQDFFCLVWVDLWEEKKNKLNKQMLQDLTGTLTDTSFSRVYISLQAVPFVC